MVLHFDVEKRVEINSGYKIETGLATKNGIVPAVITVPNKAFSTPQAKQYACLRSSSEFWFGFRLEDVPINFDWGTAITDLVLPKLDDVPYGSEAYIHSISRIEPKGNSLEIRCTIAQASNLPTIDLPENFNYRTAGNVGRHGSKTLTERDLHFLTKKAAM